MKITQTLGFFSDFLYWHDFCSIVLQGKKFKEFSPSQKWFAVGEAIAHLDYLLSQRKIVKSKVDGVYRYYLI
ncbi:MAG: hypothetical protein E7211_09040 [Clostridium lundense]|nr:hypothetical protein [Clostridium lundense]